jgi:hypothetical protein
LRPVRLAILRRSARLLLLLSRRRQSNPRADSQCDQQPAELDSQFHVTLHLLLLPAIIHLNWRW